jgi:hypothetical protein
MLASADVVFSVDYHLVEISSIPPQPAVASGLEALQARMAGTAVSAPVHTEWLVVTGIAMGPIRLRVEWLSARPSGVDESWEDVHESSLPLPAGRVVLTSPTTDSRVELGELDAGTRFRFRIHARGRNDHYDHAVTEPSEEYLILAWDGEEGPDRVLKSSRGIAGALVLRAPAGTYDTQEAAPPAVVSIRDLPRHGTGGPAAGPF